jgi:hypothetical protein
MFENILFHIIIKDIPRVSDYQIVQASLYHVNVAVSTVASKNDRINSFISVLFAQTCLQ